LNALALATGSPRRRSYGGEAATKAIFHHRDAEFTEIGGFLDQELFTLRPQRLRGEFSSQQLALTDGQIACIIAAAWIDSS
jgi:hypothetical protein